MNSSVILLSAQNSTQNMNTFLYAFLKNFFLVFLGFIINYINGTLVLTFFKNQSFYHDPRYILYIHMVVTDIIQLSVAIALHVITYIFPLINVAFCCSLLMVASFTTMTTPLNLAGMAVERYIAICNPLRHTQICTVRRTYVLIALIWGVGAAPGLADLALALRFRPLSFFRSRILCYQQSMILSPSQELKNRIAHALYMSFVWLVLIYTYLKVLFTAKSASGDPASARKARNTILLHSAQLLLCMLSYITPAVNMALLLYYPHLRAHLLFLTYLISYVLPRILSPLIYGVRDEKFWKHTKNYWQCAHCRKKIVHPKVCPTIK